MKIILPPEPPIQRLMDYIFESYGFDDSCEFVEEPEPVDVEECVECHRNSYFGKGERIYECDNFKRVYLFRYLARQFAQSELVIKEHILQLIEGKTNLSAVSLGGGPAPEALALINGLSSTEGEYNLFFSNIDCEASWEEIYHDISRQFASYIENVKLKTGFSCYDATSYVSGKRYDMVFISWLLSDMVKHDNSNVLDVARNLAASPGYVLVMDRDEDALVTKISELINGAQGLTLLEHQREHVHSIVNFPPNIKDIFGPDFGCDFAYWVLQSSSK